MKKVLSILLFVILTFSVICISTLAAKNIADYVDDGEFSLVSYNGPKNYIAKLKNPQEIEDASYWLVDNKDALNLKHVTFLGQLTGSSKNNYYNTVVPGLMDTNAFIALFGSEDDWKKEFKALADATKPLTEAGIPRGFAAAKADH